MARTATKSALLPLPIVAQRLARSWSSTYNLILSGELRGVRQGARWFVCESDLESFASAARCSTENGRRDIPANVR